MKQILIIHLFTFMTLSLSACSTSENINSSSNSLKTNNDLRVERTLSSGTWKYQPQDDDCKNTTWEQTFHTSKYYESKGDACTLPNAFTMTAENWYLKNQILYITNLSPDNGQDILIKYGVEYLDNSKLVLTRGIYTYTFTK